MSTDKNEMTKSIDEHFKVLMTDKSTIATAKPEVTIDDLPHWYNEKLFKAGQKYFRNNVLSVNAAQLFGLLSVLLIPTTLDILVFTKQSGCPASAFRRYLQTLIHIYNLFTVDIDANSNSRFWKSLNTIKWKHATNSRKSNANGLGEISQRDMALTQFGFIGYVLLSPDKLSLTNSKEDRQGINHFWRVIGYLLGISDRVNLCRENEEETTELCKKIRDQVFTNWKKNEPKDFDHMSNVMLDGFWSVDFLLNIDSVMYTWYDLNNWKYEKPLGIVSTLNIMYRKMIFYLMSLPIIGYIVRKSYNSFLSTNYWIMERWPVTAWIRFGKAHSKIHLYPIRT